MPKPGVTGLRRILNASVYSWQGLRATWQHEAAFRQELLLVAVLTPLAFFEATNLSQLLLMLLSLLKLQRLLLYRACTVTTSSQHVSRKWEVHARW